MLCLSRMTHLEILPSDFISSKLWHHLKWVGLKDDHLFGLIFYHFFYDSPDTLSAYHLDFMIYHPNWVGLTDDHLFGLVLDHCFHDSLGTLSVSLDSAFLRYSMCLHLIFMGPWALFMGPTTWKKKCKFNFKIRSHGTIHTFKNYFATVFSVFSNKRYPMKLIELSI